MSRKLITLFIAIFCFTMSANVLADEAAEIQKVKDVINEEEEAYWAGDVEKLKSLYAPDIVLVRPNIQVGYDSDYNEVIDPVHYEIMGYGSDWIESYVEGCRTRPDYLKKNPDFLHMVIIESVKVKDDVAVAAVKLVRWWTHETPRQGTRHIMRNVWILKKVKGEWKLSYCIAHIAGGWRTFNLRPPLK